MKRNVWAPIVIGILSAIPMAASLQSVANANSRPCSCVDYVKNRFGITASVGHALNMNGSLPQHSFQKLSGPAVGAVVVMQPSFKGSDGQYGHVGIVESIDGQGRIRVRGANQGSNGASSEAGCSNVTVLGFAPSVFGRNDVAFWSRGGGSPVATTPSTGNVVGVNFSASTRREAVNIRSGPGTNHAQVGRLSPNQRVNFDAWTFGSVVQDPVARSSDARWYRIAGTNNWVSSAAVAGNAPNSRPMP
jgi:surface antigen